jgi:hypothetical protein
LNVFLSTLFSNALGLCFSLNVCDRVLHPYKTTERNTVIKQKMNVERSLLDDIKTKQLQWYGQVQRMEEGRLPKEVMKWRPPGRRKRGRPKLTWEEGIRGLMEERELMEEDWNDRNSWRKMMI